MKIKGQQIRETIDKTKQYVCLRMKLRKFSKLTNFYQKSDSNPIETYADRN